MKPEKSPFPIIQAIYRHYKGNFYTVICVATHTETKEALVCYQCRSTGTYYARSLKEFMGIDPLTEISRFELYFNPVKQDKTNEDL